MVKPKFNKEIFPNAFIRKGVGELTLRTGEAGTLHTFINTANVGAGRWRPPLVDEDWHAVCQAIYKGVEGAAWEKLCCKFVEMNTEVNVRSPGGSSRAKMLRTTMDATDRGDAHHDQTHVKKE